MDKVFGYLGLIFFILSILPVPIYVFAGGSRREHSHAGVHTIIIAIGFSLFGALIGTSFLKPFILFGIAVMGYLTYFAAVETGMVKARNKKVSRKVK